MLPQVRAAVKAGMAVVLLDPNAGMFPEEMPSPSAKFTQPEWWQTLPKDESDPILPEGKDEMAHMMYMMEGHNLSHAKAVWDQVVAPSAAKQIALLGHSMGGACFLHVLGKDPSARERVRAVAFSDCVGAGAPEPVEVMAPFLASVARRWYSSAEPLDTVLEGGNRYNTMLDFTCVSSGTPVHNLGPSTALESIFVFFGARLAEGLQ